MTCREPAFSYHGGPRHRFRVVSPLLSGTGAALTSATILNSEPDVTYLFTEVSLQAQAHFGRLSPYLGLGGGRAFRVGGPDPRQHAVDTTWSRRLSYRGF